MGNDYPRCRLMRHLCMAVVLVLVLLIDHGKARVSSGKGRRPRSNFDFSEHVEAVYRPERTLALSARGVSLRQATNPPSVTEQLMGTGFADISCDINARTWEVTYVNALEEAVFGLVNTTVIAQCYTGEVPRFLLQPLEVEHDVQFGQVVSTAKFIMNNPDVEQLVLACTFELFVFIEGQLSAPRLISVFQHFCDQSDGKQCGFAELFCLIDIDEYKGAAIFWYAIFILEILLLTFIGFFYSSHSLQKDLNTIGEVNEYLYSQTSIRLAHPDGMAERMSTMDDNAIAAKVHQLRQFKFQTSASGAGEGVIPQHAASIQQKTAASGDGKVSQFFTGLVSLGQKRNQPTEVEMHEVSVFRNSRRENDRQGLLGTGDPTDDESYDLGTPGHTTVSLESADYPVQYPFGQVEPQYTTGSGNSSASGRDGGKRNRRRKKGDDS